MFILFYLLSLARKLIIQKVLLLSLQPDSHFPCRLGQPQRDVRGRASTFRRGQSG
jgi:hypothetical protein